MKMAREWGADLYSVVEIVRSALAEPIVRLSDGGVDPPASQCLTPRFLFGLNPKAEGSFLLEEYAALDGQVDIVGESLWNGFGEIDVLANLSCVLKFRRHVRTTSIEYP
jgi:hypothetical protein